MKYIIVAVLLLSVQSSFSQSTTGWHHIFTGNMGHENLNISLSKSGNKYIGYLWLDSNQSPVPLYQSNPDSKSDTLEMQTASEYSITLKGILKTNQFSGTGWIQKDSVTTDTLPFQLTVSKDPQFTQFQYISTEAKASLPSRLKNQSTAHYFSASIWPSATTKIGSSIKYTLSKMLGANQNLGAPKQWMNSQQTKFINKWKQQNNKLTIANAAQMGMSLSAEEYQYSTVFYENKHSITLAHYLYSFTGGAHGNYVSTLVNLNKINGKKILLSDVLNSKGIKELPSLLDKAARLKYHINNTDSLEKNGFFVNTLTPPKEFYITSGGIGFLYGIYEIKPYVDGEINLFLPLEDLQAYIKPGIYLFKKSNTTN